MDLEIFQSWIYLFVSQSHQIQLIHLQDHLACLVATQKPSLLKE